MLSRLRSFFTAVLGPIARLLLRMGVSPDVVTVVGTLGVVVAALTLFPTGHLFGGTMVITVFVFSDLVDGIMARTAGRSGRWGAFLDSTLDRFADAAIFCGLLVHLERTGDTVGAAFALAALVLGSIVPYARARAEGLGMTAQVGIAERADRLVSVLVATGLVGLGVTPVLLDVVLVLLALASAITVVQRMATVYRQATAGSGGTESRA
ncbi:CDP-alcohol phosphatidyltransferase family protein [Isoptericola sp. b441]|uniref:Phosphatidylinositol phosphate synthase n=1 Tax=Actinotalea lenta TaxID=3064654 RepID=A0ABT9DEW5_9CELL|nr:MULTISPECIES: CDP-alcohol phosphatidyltransferase family protein [unclassified Isoptericola]MDO8107832.1 CDP-alcohol phosphatidyltransferase family protein [Isoptericola sp. b441]MDO8120497.1 CDP-alcohol phosphatidyltransferase family protein [Isoptericola sp. b490]